MSKRYAVLGLSVFLALALAVPALGGPSNPVASISASVKQTANKALKKAKAAQNTANTALSAANSAQGDATKAGTEAGKALTEAKKAQTSAQAAQTTANAAKTAAAAAEANANTRLKGINRNFGTATAENTETPKSASAGCLDEATEEVTGGGFSVFGAGQNQVTIGHSEPIFPLYGNGWFVEGRAISGTPTWELQTVVFCAHK